MEENEKLLFALLRQALESGQSPDLSHADLLGLYELAQRHQLAHLIAHALDKHMPLCGPFQQRLLEAHYRTERYGHAYEALCQLFHREKIDFIPLKGLILRNFYPEPWMRTSCDMDLLLRPEDLERAGQLLEDTLHYRPKAMSGHDISYISADGVCVELHHTLIEHNPVLASVWDHCPDGQMPGDYFYLYHIAHAAKHFTHGGCGIRSVLELWLMEGRGITCDDALLTQCGLRAFTHALRRLADFWFAEGPADETVLDMHRLILTGGAYGTDSNQQLLGSATSPKLSRLFLSERELQYTYPVLRRHRWLLPVCQLRRWGRLLMGLRIRRRPKLTDLLSRLGL